MKRFDPVQVQDIPPVENTAQLRDAFNKKLREIVAKTNTAIASLTAGTLDIGLWASNSQILTVTVDDEYNHEAKTELGVRHTLGRVPKYGFIIDAQRVEVGATDVTTGDVWPHLQRGLTAWTDTMIYLYPSSDAVAYRTTFKLLIF